MKKITIKKLAEMQYNVKIKGGVACRFKTSENGLVMWLCRKKILDNNFFFVMLPSLTCEVEMSCEPLNEDVLKGFIEEQCSDFNGTFVYKV